MNLIKSFFLRTQALAKYFIYSIIVAVADTLIVWILVRCSVTGIVSANTIGVITGFILHYILSSRSVFNAEYGICGFVIYLSTFLFGLGLANGIIFLCYEYVFAGYAIDLRLLLSKGVSIAAPFFVMYFMRKYLFGKLNKSKTRNGENEKRSV